MDLNDAVSRKSLYRHIGFNKRMLKTPPALERVKINIRAKGQGLTEFALILPILLLLIFGLIEFARALQAYLVIANAARFGVRYAVTGEYDVKHCQDGLDAGNKACDGDGKLEEEDAARLASIYDVVNGTAVAILKNAGVSKGTPGFFHVTVCSSRQGFNYDRIGDLCNPYDDPGDPKEGTTRVLVSVTFQHPFILPFLTSIWPSIRLHSERTGILEQFRSARVLGLPPEINVPSPTRPPATNTPPVTPTEPPPPATVIPPTPTPSPTFTQTPTPTNTATPTPAPSCDDLATDPVEPLYLNGDDLEIPLRNLSGIYAIQLTTVETTWNGGWHDEVDPSPADQAFESYLWNGALLLDPENVSLASAISFAHSDLGLLGVGVSGALELDFIKSFSSYYVYYHGHDFTVKINYTVGGLSCMKTVTGLYGPVVNVNTPTGTITGGFTVNATASDPDPGGSINRVVFEVRDASNRMVFQRIEINPPYCLAGDEGGTCKPITGAYWPGTRNPIENSLYRIYVQARDNDLHRHYTRVMDQLLFNLPPTLTPTITQTPTVTPTPSRTPTQGPVTATRTPTVTQTHPTAPEATSTPTRTPKATFTNTPTVTNPPPTPTRTPTPRTPRPATPTPREASPTPTKTYTPTPTPRTPPPGGG